MSHTTLPVVPLTLEGSSVLHQMMRFDWNAWRATPAAERDAASAGLAVWLAERASSACYAMLGHKGDLLFLHFRPDFPGLLEAQTSLAQLAIGEYLEPAHSYLSMVELGLYESTRKIYEDCAARGLEPGSDAWQAAVKETLDRQRAAMAARLFPAIPEARYLCFYPMDRKRGEAKNWYAVPFAERQRMMHEHGVVGRKYAGVVRQIISGSIGFDDWEWGVDLFADDPLPFKQIIYEMRFDEVSAAYALFGEFFIGLRLQAGAVAEFLNGDVAQALRRHPGAPDTV